LSRGLFQASGDRWQETGVRRQVAGDRRQETGGRRQAAGDRWQETDNLGGQNGLLQRPKVAGKAV